MSSDDKIRVRRECNSIIRNSISLLLEINRDLNYLQALYLLDFIRNQDQFHEEPYDTVKNSLVYIKDLLFNDFPKDSTIVMRLIRAVIKDNLEYIGLL